MSMQGTKTKKSISYIYLIFVVFQIKMLKEEKRVNKCRYGMLYIVITL